MLGKPHRMRSSEDFRATVRYGVRAGHRTVVVHARMSSSPDPVRVGFVVSKAVGNAVVRNSVKRRLRHLVSPQLAESPTGSTFVVRALPPAAMSAEDLSQDLPKAWSRAVARLNREMEGAS